jgi:hypothetical protein
VLLPTYGTLPAALLLCALLTFSRSVPEDAYRYIRATVSPVLQRMRATVRCGVTGGQGSREDSRRAWLAISLHYLIYTEVRGFVLFLKLL